MIYLNHLVLLNRIFLVILLVVDGRFFWAFVWHIFVAVSSTRSCHINSGYTFLRKTIVDNSLCRYSRKMFYSSTTLFLLTSVFKRFDLLATMFVEFKQRYLDRASLGRGSKLERCKALCCHSRSRNFQRSWRFPCALHGCCNSLPE